MSNKFRIYSTEIDPTLDPDNAVPLPTTLIDFEEDPDTLNYDPTGTSNDRGSVWDTLGGKVYQDFGVKEVDDTISFSNSDSVSPAIVASLKTAYETIDGEWYFTDGYNCWKVRFSRSPMGYRSWLNTFYAYKGRMYYSYEIQLLVLSKEI